MAQDTREPTQAQQASGIPREHELPMLAGIAAVQHWFEELLNLLCVPLLTAGMGIALMDLLTGGDFIHAVPWLLFAWAGCQALGVDALLPGSAGKLRRAVMERRWGAVLGYVLLVALLAYVAIVAALVFGYREVFHLDTRAALSALGIDDTSLVWQRAVFSVVMVPLAAFLRYRPPAQSTLADERAKLERELELEPLRQQLRVRQALGVRQLGTAIVRGTSGPAAAAVAPDLDRPPTGPGAPTVAPAVPSPREPDTKPLRHPALPAPITPPEDPGEEALRPAATVLAPTDLRAARKMAADAARRAAAFALLDANPGMSRKALRKEMKCGQQRANELYAAWEYERGRQARGGQAQAAR